jgi:hypothetical protein
MENTWLEKYKREQWTMPFGSMCNAYGQLMAGQVDRREQFFQDMKRIYELSQEFIKKSVEPEQAGSIKAVNDFIKKVETRNSIKNPTNYSALDSQREDNLNNA